MARIGFFSQESIFVSHSWPVNDAISGEILAKESRFPRSEIFFATLVDRWTEVGGKIFPRIRLTSAKDLVEVEAELGNITHPVAYSEKLL